MTEVSEGNMKCEDAKTGEISEMEAVYEDTNGAEGAELFVGEAE